jgi:hypothetical protein
LWAWHTGDIQTVQLGVVDRVLTGLGLEWWDVYDPADHDPGVFRWRQRDDVWHGSTPPSRPRGVRGCRSDAAGGMTDLPEIVTRDELARILRVSVSTIDRMHRDGMPAVTWGRRLVRFRLSQALAWAEQRDHEAA